MADPFIGEIRLFGGSYAPLGWAFCDGQILSIGDNEILFTLLGTTYGGDGESTFALPDLRGRLPVHQGNGPGLSPRPIGLAGGTETVTLRPADWPGHTHTLLASNEAATSSDPTGHALASPTGNFYGPGPATTPTSEQATTVAGGSQPHDNRMPSLCLSFIIALEGIYPTQN